MGLSLTVSCSPARDAAPLWTERDSAGVRIVENHRDSARIPGWSLGERPILRFGGYDAPEEQQIFQVHGARRLADGRIALANAGSQEIRVYAADGALLRAFGHKGDGPGEFQDPGLVGVLGSDTLVVYDSRLQRVSFLHVDEGFVRAAAVEWHGKGFPVARGLDGPGALVVGGGMSFSSREGFPTGVIRPESTFGWIRLDGTGEVHLGDFRAAEMFARADERGFMARALPFARATTAAPGPDGVYLGPADGYEIRFMDVKGALVRIVRWDAHPREVTRADLNAFVESELEDAATENDRRQLRSLFDEMPVPATMPPYRELRVDAPGNVWVEDYPAPGDHGVAWTVFDASGHIAARITTPPRTRLLDIGQDHVVALQRDDFDAEVIVVWTLRRAALAPTHSSGGVSS